MPSKFPSYDTLRAKKDGKYMAELSLLTEVTDDRETNSEGLPTTCDSETKTDDSVFTDTLSGGERLSSTHEVDVTEDSGRTFFLLCPLCVYAVGIIIPLINFLCLRMFLNCSFFKKL